ASSAAGMSPPGRRCSSPTGASSVSAAPGPGSRACTRGTRSPTSSLQRGSRLPSTTRPRPSRRATRSSPRSRPSTRCGSVSSSSSTCVQQRPKGEHMPEMRLDHLSFLVGDLDEAITKGRKILGSLDPGQADRITYGEGIEGGEEMRWATFVNPAGCSIQLFQPLSDGFLKKILDKRGETVHHLAFLSSDVDTTVQQLRDADIPVLQE